jgi:hypothetical protein
MAVVSWVVDLDVAEPMRMPDDKAAHAVVAGVRIRRLAVAPRCDPVPIVLVAVISRSLEFGDAPVLADVAL